MDEKRLWNLSDLEAFGLNRATIRKRLKAAGIEPRATGRSNTALYDIIEVAPHLCQRPQKQTDAPDLMGFKTAAELRAYIQAEREKLALEQDSGELITRADYENEIAMVIAAIKKFAGTAITRVESAIPNATGEQLEKLEILYDHDLKAVSDELQL